MYCMNVHVDTSADSVRPVLNSDTSGKVAIPEKYVRC